MKPSTIKISQHLQSIAHGLDKVIADVAGERIGFTLIVFTEGRASYVSNAERQTVVAELKKLLACWEQGMPDVPAHDYRS